MQKTLVIVALSVLALGAMPVTDAAAHLAAWKASGVAMNGTTAFLIDVSWNGGFWCQSTYTVAIKDLNGAVLEQRTFGGYENQVQGPGQNYVQETFTVSGGSFDPSIAFQFSGQQVATLNFLPPTYTNVLRGTYQGLTWTAVTIAAPFVLGC